MDKRSGLSASVQVADSGFYAGAARALGITPFAAGKTIVRLEEQLEIRLFHRNTRTITLAAEGARFPDRCGVIMDAVAVAERELAMSRRDLRGKLRVGVPLVNRLRSRVLLSFTTAPAWSPSSDALGDRHRDTD
ncbi:LysR family transcriptional regulator [Methylobacterium sp. 17Sr1-1]|uniref:LysR family transcriptional regulator n=1 Tax=Methylobacterium sp. 17Sr1-1 TaxID=2202826 RepID=UPI0013A53D8E|nr:LysR family transcriptional regulator [Methylobacterium sp. 17Sr1-1]